MLTDSSTIVRFSATQQPPCCSCNPSYSFLGNTNQTDSIGIQPDTARPSEANAHDSASSRTCRTYDSISAFRRSMASLRLHEGSGMRASSMAAMLEHRSREDSRYRIRWSRSASGRSPSESCNVRAAMMGNASMPSSQTIPRYMVSRFNAASSRSPSPCSNAVEPKAPRFPLPPRSAACPARNPACARDCHYQARHHHPHRHRHGRGNSDMPR